MKRHIKFGNILSNIDRVIVDSWVERGMTWLDSKQRLTESEQDTWDSE